MRRLYLNQYTRVDESNKIDEHPEMLPAAAADKGHQKSTAAAGELLA